MASLFSIAVAGIAAAANLLPGAQVTGQLDVTSARTLLELSRELSEKYGWIVSYEDAPVTSAQHLVRVDDKNGRSWVFVRPSRISLKVQNSVGLTAEARGLLMQEAVGQHNRSDSPAHYGFVVNGELVRIYPSRILSSAGELIEFAPLLDTQISFPAGKYQLGGIVFFILAEVGRLRGVDIAVGNFAPNLTAVEVTEESRNEPAGVVLNRVLDSVNGRRLAEGMDRLIFRSELVYLPESRTYMYNAIIAKRIQSVPSALPRDPKENSQGDRRFQK